MKNTRIFRGMVVCLLAATLFVQDISALFNQGIGMPRGASALAVEGAVWGNATTAASLAAMDAAARNEESRRIMADEMALLIPETPPPAYRQVDAFANAANHKGLQGMMSPEYGGQHTLLNLWIDSYIDDEDPGTFDYCFPYEYNGTTFYFDLSGIEMFMERIQTLNAQNISVSMVFLLKYTEGREFLIDEGSRVPGYKYYAPATTGLGAEGIQAFFEFFMWRCAAWNASVDNFILGNEINNPSAWHYSGTLNATTVAAKYAATFSSMYQIVRKYTDISRCSISLDHNWTHNDHGRQIPGRIFLDLFHAELEKIQPGIDWCVSYHLYPAIMYNTAIWRWSGYNADNPYAMFVDGVNLHVLTDYIKDTFGPQHRIMLTEQGFSIYNNNEVYQAAALAISYYAAKYNPMVDCFILYCETLADPRLNFSVEGRLAQSIYTKLDSGDAADLAEIEQLIWEVTGRNVSELVPYYGTQDAAPML